jgi:uncharacterized membrane protein YtjA (UPF0391 family)
MPVSAQTKAPPSAWIAAKRKQPKRYVVLGLSGLRGNPSATYANVVFFLVIAVLKNLLIMRQLAHKLKKIYELIIQKKWMK